MIIGYYLVERKRAEATRGMRQGTYWTLVEQAMSSDRLRPYRLTAQDPATEIHGRYVWNVALSEALYPSLQGFEVALRNSLHTVIAGHFGTEWWFFATLPSGLPLLRAQEMTALNDATKRVSEQLRRVGRPMIAGDIVAGLHLGFWNNLFVSHYEGVGLLWPGLITTILPYAPRGAHRARGALFNRIKALRELRNRISHFEPIWNLQHLQTSHAQILETTEWLSPAMAAQARLVDRFPTVYGQGWRPFEANLITFLRSLPA